MRILENSTAVNSVFTHTEFEPFESSSMYVYGVAEGILTVVILTAGM